jgi:hypothetical protein
MSRSAFGTAFTIEDQRSKHDLMVRREMTKAHYLSKVTSVSIIALLFFSSFAATANPFDPVRGSWRGAVQFESTASPDAHSVGQFEAHIGADGQIDAVHTNGCRLSGVIAQQSPNFYRLDVRAQGCSYALFNRRWGGYVVYKVGQRVLSISASSSETGPDRKLRQFDFNGTLQR